MTLMFMPGTPYSSTALPLTRSRMFRVHLRCQHCKVRDTVDIEMMSEPDTRGSTEDFYRAGGHRLIENECAACGVEGIMIEDVAYVPAPNEAPPSALAEV